MIDVVHDTLLPWSSYLDWEPEPSIVTVANVQHLGTRMEGRLSQPRPDVLELVRALSPTPALGGAPARRGDRPDRAGGRVSSGGVTAAPSAGSTPRKRHLGRRDPLRRALARSPVGPARSPAAASSPTAIRCRELAETQAKFQAMLSAIVRP